MPSAFRALIIGAAVATAIIGLAPMTSALSPEAAEIQLQLADLLFADGRYIDAFDAYEQIKTTDDTRVRRHALAGAVMTSLRLADYAHAYADAELLMEIAARDPEAIALYGDALWAQGQFEESEQQFKEALALQRDLPRGLHGMARSLAARSRLEEALDLAQDALRSAPRDAEIHHTVGSIYERLHRYEEAATAFTSFMNLLPNRDRSAKAAWTRAEIRFLRAFGKRVPLQMDEASARMLHTLDFKVVDEKIIVMGRVNRGPEIAFALDTGSEQTVIARETASRLGIRAIANTLSAGVGDLGVRELELTRLDQLEFGTLRIRNVPAIIKNPPLRGLPTREAESFSPLALGLSVIVDYERQQLIIGRELPLEPGDVELPLRLHRLAMVGGQVDGGPASFILDTGGQVISISTDTASTLTRPMPRHIPLKVYGSSGWDRDAFLMPGVNLAFREIEFSNYPVVVLNLRAPSVLLGFRLGGIVGHKFLSQYRVAIDLIKSVVRLTARTPNPVRPPGR